MRTKSIRTVVATAAIGVVSAAAALTLFDAGAGAAPRNNYGNITGGSATISMSSATLAALGASGLDAWQTGSPATTSYDSTNDRYDYTFPVTGGDASVQTFYGVELEAGTLVLHDHNTNKTVTLREPRFDISSDVFTAVPTPTHKRMAIFDANGEHTFNGTASQNTGGNESFSASDLQVDPAGAAYLNNAFGETVFTAGESVGDYSTSFTNTVG